LALVILDMISHGGGEWGIGNGQW